MQERTALALDPSEKSAVATAKSAISISGSGVSPELKTRIEKLSGQKVTQCYQCGECTAGCPMAFAMDIMPNRVMRMAQLGTEKQLLESSSIWLCAGCETCATRCPKGVELSKVMDALRQIAIADGAKTSESEIVKFHKVFLNAVKKDGRVHEVGMIGKYKLATGKWFDDMGLGIKMFRKGKLSLAPSKIKGADEIRKIFEKLGGNK